nr:immunoglobulin light chain junction region [Macaca mulatta]
DYYCQVYDSAGVLF